MSESITAEVCIDTSASIDNEQLDQFFGELKGILSSYPHVRVNLYYCDTELFGPVLSVIKFKTEEEVISLANDTKHGLAAGIFSKSNSRCLRVSKAVHAGIVWVNTYRVVSPIAEFGGFKNSGYGRESGFQAIYDYTRPKTVWMNMSDEPAANPFVMK